MGAPARAFWSALLAYVVIGGVLVARTGGPTAPAPVESTNATTNASVNESANATTNASAGANATERSPGEIPENVIGAG